MASRHAPARPKASIGPQPSPLAGGAPRAQGVGRGDRDMLAAVAGLAGAPARTRTLAALVGGGALTAKVLAYFAGVTAPTASSHLARLVDGELLVMEKQGRCHYYRLRSAEVARAIEGLMTVTPAAPNGWPPGHRVQPALREARMCYD